LAKGDQQQQQKATFDHGHLPLGPPEGYGGERMVSATETQSQLNQCTK